jgi:hypothetical protein
MVIPPRRSIRDMLLPSSSSLHPFHPHGRHLEFGGLGVGVPYRPGHPVGKYKDPGKNQKGRKVTGKRQEPENRTL